MVKPQLNHLFLTNTYYIANIILKYFIKNNSTA